MACNPQADSPQRVDSNPFLTKFSECVRLTVKIQQQIADTAQLWAQDLSRVDSRVLSHAMSNDFSPTHQAKQYSTSFVQYRTAIEVFNNGKRSKQSKTEVGRDHYRRVKRSVLLRNNTNSFVLLLQIKLIHSSCLHAPRANKLLTEDGLQKLQYLPQY
ncbi:hypothetical protein OESDEN_04431 [Oesophagostomum dentatum]|uniref:Uncharacterized protein n=1 Tax=Oesophagostomum dentatum TaxID=61180 RepID=A0A0B1THS2_OESDE|nr:hypothetical protein OESDEN_04431 [Oesophagostomum dentatum]